MTRGFIKINPSCSPAFCLPSPSAAREAISAISAPSPTYLCGSALYPKSSQCWDINRRAASQQSSGATTPPPVIFTIHDGVMILQLGFLPPDNTHRFEGGVSIASSCSHLNNSLSGREKNNRRLGYTLTFTFRIRKIPTPPSCRWSCCVFLFPASLHTHIW